MNLPRLHLSYGKRLQSARDWVILLVIGVIAVFISLAVNVWTFDRVVKGGVLGEPPSTQDIVFDASRLEKLVDLFARQAAKQREYVEGTVQFVDPSLL